MIAAVVCLAVSAAAAPAPPEARIREAFERQIIDSHARGRAKFSSTLPPLRVQRAAWGFRFAADLGCDDPDDDRDFCALAGPKAWTDEEIEAMGRLLRPLLDAKLGRFLRRVRENGFDTLVRESFVAHFERDSAWRRLFYPNSLHSNGLVVISDAQFAAREAPAKPVLHLLAHAYDFSRGRDGRFYPSLSVSPEFLRMTGFELGDDGSWTLKNMTPPQRAAYMELFNWKNAAALEAQATADRARRAAAWSEIFAKTDAFARPFGAPTFHALLNPYESFAEWVTFVHFDEEKARALNPELTRWLKDKVLR